MRIILLFIGVLLSSQLLAQQPRVAIIIDDIGYRTSDLATLTLPGNITFSILPHTPYGKSIAEEAFSTDHDVILHIPMEAENGKKLGPGALTREMNEQGIRESLRQSFAEIPFAIGINNHMGSYLTKHYSPMAWTMRYLKENNRVFIDSVTTEQSKARGVARHFGVPSLSRHIFLDNELNQSYISGQFTQLIDQAKKYKQVVAIAHPHPETIEALTHLIPQLEAHNIKLVGISSLLLKTPIHTAKVETD